MDDVLMFTGHGICCGDHGICCGEIYGLNFDQFHLQ